MSTVEKRVYNVRESIGYTKDFLERRRFDAELKFFQLTPLRFEISSSSPRWSIYDLWYIVGWIESAGRKSCPSANGRTWEYAGNSFPAGLTGPDPVHGEAVLPRFLTIDFFSTLLSIIGSSQKLGRKGPAQNSKFLILIREFFSSCPASSNLFPLDLFYFLDPFRLVRDFLRLLVEFQILDFGRLWSCPRSSNFLDPFRLFLSSEVFSEKTPRT